MSDPESSAKGAAAQRGLSSTEADVEITADPLFGASPPADASSSRADPQPSVQVQASEASPRKSLDGHQSIDDPLYGASPPQDSNSSVFHSTPRASSTIAFLKRLSSILSVILGASASIAGIWSYFILPLLHSSFSARKALLDQQVPRYAKLLEGLRALRSNKLYGPPLRVGEKIRDEKSGSRKTRDEDGKKRERDGVTPRPTIRREASLKEITSSASVSSSSTTHPNDTQDHDHNADVDHVEPTPPSQPLVPFSSLQALRTHLNSLTSALDNTSTTRTSLISTLESYTSHLHRQMFVSRAPGSGFGSAGGGGGFGGYSIGGTLGMNLKQASGSGGAAASVGITGNGDGEAWDSVRKEIRAIKGLLLNRRAFAHAQTAK
ncbi:hypothetical protein I316_06067 [Kwoniella heveanensis BCC8398]|uniref:Peroxin-14 n=1 Tax=Kwoniella heveanensis BCC8398 TaxID=1296120 RepID=A0A1B9GME4_9TREE|nr:hypothetical protein I316_06067 [Kwoniella heveanensis BCC8398]